MTYDESKVEFGRQPATIVEMDLDFCNLTYGTSPCTASIGVTGTDKCYNTRKTCQDAVNYDPAAKTYRFATRQLPTGTPQVIPSVKSVKLTPARIDPGKGLGTRSSCTVVFNDHTFADHGVDKYIRERTWDSETRSTYWVKLLARNPYYQGRALRVKSGYLAADGTYDDTLFETRTYFIDKIEGPDKKGKVTVVAKDILKLADDTRSQCPLPNVGKLLIDINTVVTTATLTPAGIGDEEYASSGTVAVGQECMTFTRTADVLTLVRGTDGTTAEQHNADDTVQQCKRFTNAKVQDITSDLLINFANIPSSFIDMTQWDEEANTWLPSHLLTTLITKPTGVNLLLSELCQQALFYIWYDERLQSIPFRAIRPVRFAERVEIDTISNILTDTVTITEYPDQRITQLWTFYGRANPTEELTKESNYRRLYITADLNAEGTQQYGESRIRKIYSRWLPLNNDAPAALLGARMIARYKNNPKSLKLQLDAKDSSLWTGDVAAVSCRAIVSPTGEILQTNMQVIEVGESEAGTTYSYELQDTFFAGRYAFVTEDDQVDYSDATVEQQTNLGFISPDTEVFADGEPAYKII